MSWLEEGILQAHGRESSQVFQPNWHPEKCRCGECNTWLQQEEQQVLSQFEDEINRLEDDVRRNAQFSSTSQRYIDAECLLGKQSSDYTQKLFKGFPAREKEVGEDEDRRGRNPRTTDGKGSDEGDGEGPGWRGCDASDENKNEVPENPRVDTEGYSSVRKRYIIYNYAEDDTQNDEWKLEREGDYGWVDEGKEATETVDVGADDQHLHNGYGPLVEADDPGSGTHHHHRPSYTRQSQSWEGQQSVKSQMDVHHSLGRQQSLESQMEQCYSSNNETVYNKALRVRNKRSLTLRIKDTIRRRYRVASRTVRYYTHVL